MRKMKQAPYKKNISVFINSTDIFFFLPASQWTVLRAPHFGDKWSPFQIYQQQAEKSCLTESGVFWTTSKTTHHASLNRQLANDTALPSYFKKKRWDTELFTHSSRADSDTLAPSCQCLHCLNSDHLPDNNKLTVEMNVQLFVIQSLSSFTFWGKIVQKHRT